MKRSLSFLLVALSLVVFLPTTASAAVPDFVTYSGRLTDGTGWGQSDFVDLTFRIYDCGCAPDGQCGVPCEEWPGTPLKEQAFPGAAIQDGYFSVILTGVANVFGAHDQTWITVCVGEGCTPGDDLLPRQAVGSVPYAMKATACERAVLAGTTEIQIGDMRYALSAVFKGTTYEVPEVAEQGSFDSFGRTTGAILFGGAVRYKAANLACQAALNSPSAHFCTSIDMVISDNFGLLNLPVKQVWIATGSSTRIYLPESGKYAYYYDCRGWQAGVTDSGSGTQSRGQTWDWDNHPTDIGCGTALPLACCDHPNE